MNELEDIYKRIEYLRNNGVKMKEIADWLINRVKQKRHLQKQMSFF